MHILHIALHIMKHGYKRFEALVIDIIKNKKNIKKVPRKSCIE